MQVYKRSLKIIVTTLLVYGLLVATHLGEFWPFSIYPMFSQGANPWTRSLVMDVSMADDHQKWTTTEVDQLPGESLILSLYGIDQIDLANFVSKTEDWYTNRLNSLRTMFGEDLIASKDLMVVKVNGLIHDDNTITMEAVPYLLLSADSTYLNPNLPQSSYFKSN
ncbi:MAG: hypothetical protein WEB89_01350 [Balneolales bacterium]